MPEQRYHVGLENWFKVNGVDQMLFKYLGGRVISPARVETVYSLADALSWLNPLEAYVSLVRDANADVEDIGPTPPMEEEWKFTEDSIRLKLEVGDYKLNVKYDRDTQMFTSEARDEYDITWSEWVHFRSAYHRLMHMVKGEWLHL